MSSEPALRLSGVSKRYRLGVTTGLAVRGRAQRTTTVDALTTYVKRRRSKEKRPEFWALRDIGFEVDEGEVVGLVGRNGAGKSTVLKLISRISDLTEGRIDVHGRVGSLLEVGTGFHPELTGRENIYLNGSILGMRRSEIDVAFDEIVEFSGVEQFLDTPVKRYSSGMSVRLAFSVAAHLRTEILLVDEVLSVGDKAFREKCLGKLSTVSEAGRTVIYVSHLMETVTALCTRALFLEKGRLTMDGPVDDVVGAYIARQSEATDLMQDLEDRPGSGVFRFVDAAVEADTYASHDEKVIDFALVQRGGNFGGRMKVVAKFVDQRETVVAHIDSGLVEYELYPAARHRGRLRVRTPWLRPGRYRVDLSILSVAGALIDDVQGACFLEVSPRHPYPGSLTMGKDASGSVLADFEFEELDADLPVNPAANGLPSGNGRGSGPA
jgi:lipopolysaccharide transport system ATP-binding protein